MKHLNMYNHPEIIEENDDFMKTVIKCPYCQQITTVGELIGISGYHGCPNCYSVPDGLRDVVLYLQENDYNTYSAGKFYQHGYIANREDLQQRKERDSLIAARKRDKKTLREIKDISVILQYLYAYPEHTIRYTNFLEIPLEISMDNDCNLYIRNLEGPQLGKLPWRPTVKDWLSLIKQLETQQPQYYFQETLKDRWEEICVMVSLSNICNRREK